ncbi:MAG: hypothetical protein KJO30_02455 [Boseongicola sp.]|nr:hypothetical protein [Boseongicola sp.]NNJ67136.1 hypothetical protein [Boseongicola sp.]
MYGRITHFKGDPARLDGMVGRILAIREQLKAIHGGAANYAMWNDDGTGVAIAVYDSEASANAAVPQIQEIWGVLADFLVAPPEIVSYAHAENTRG